MTIDYGQHRGPGMGAFDVWPIVSALSHMPLATQRTPLRRRNEGTKGAQP